MKTELHQVMASGVFVEYRDAHGNTVGRAVYADWQGRPVPNTGDTLVCSVGADFPAPPRRMAGIVLSRQFDLQTDADGEPSVWVYIIAQHTTAESSAPRKLKVRDSFSPN